MTQVSKSSPEPSASHQLKANANLKLTYGRLTHKSRTPEKLVPAQQEDTPRRAEHKEVSFINGGPKKGSPALHIFWLLWQRRLLCCAVWREREPQGWLLSVLSQRGRCRWLHRLPPSVPPLLAKLMTRCWLDWKWRHGIFGLRESTLRLWQRRLRGSCRRRLRLIGLPRQQRPVHCMTHHD